MKSCESTVDGTRILSETSRREITNGVAVGEALGAIWAECESSNNPFTLKWESIGSKWRIIAKYDSNRRRDAQAIARQSTWQGRVNQDGKGSRGIWIMPLMIVAGKHYVEG